MRTCLKKGTDSFFLSETTHTQDGQALVSGKNTIQTDKKQEMGLKEKYRAFKNVISGEWGIFNSPRTPTVIRSDDGNNFLFYRGADKCLARPGRKKLQRQKILFFIYPIYIHNWRNITTIYVYIYIYIYKTRLASNEIFWPSNKIHREAPRYKILSMATEATMNGKLHNL